MHISKVMLMDAKVNKPTASVITLSAMTTAGLPASSASARSREKTFK